MRIILPNPRGFCAGVSMAIDVVNQVLDLCPGQPVYVYHDIVHNTHVVNRFKAKGVRFVEDVDLVPSGSILIFSAHGIPPSVRQRALDRGLRVIDATCPLVTKVHNEAIRYARLGYQIILIGHRNHQEVIGTMGEAPQAIQVVETPQDIERLRIDDPQKLVYLTQTTLSTDDAKIIIDALKRAFPAIKAPPSEDICYATTNRQQAVRVLAPMCDLTLVVGSRHSSNSVRLTEISANAGTPARLVEDASQMDASWFPSPEATVLVTAGASAPEDLVAEVCRSLLERFGGHIETCDVHEEDAYFAPPAGLRQIMRSRGIDPKDRAIRVTKPTITAERYGATALTISAPATR
ncbi:MAG: 4-hydroxy-3-methylbut-2-enyl diphosphate reductase [Phycisphaerales bacterium]|nr:MAG: 4-hydroxy-3-methylbut-2-enyl diphosphate reductase [Phycisphaerales bacterium]